MSFKRPNTHLVVGLLMSGLVLLGQFSSVAHLLLVRHVTCAEHGELIHGDEAVAPVAARSAGLEIGSAPASIDAHGHDHCLSWTPRREDLLPVLHAGVSVLPVVEAVVSPFEPRVTPGFGVALLRLAPKSSPPV